MNYLIDQNIESQKIRMSKIRMSKMYRGYMKSPQGYAKLKKPTQMKLIWVEYFIWGYAKGIHF
jgi:hypothetical protein